MKIWLHRVSHLPEIADPLLKKGYISIGFSDFSNRDFINEINGKGGWEKFEEAFNNEWGYLPRNRYTLWRFLNEMKKGDWVLVPRWGTFSLYEVEGEQAEPIANMDFSIFEDWHGKTLAVKNNLLHYENTASAEAVDLGFIRKLKLIQNNIPRYEYADSALTSRMKIRSTNADISDLNTSIEKALYSFNNNKPINLHSEIITSTSKVVLTKIRDKLNDQKLEKLIKWYFERIGASDVYIPAKNEADKEGDADVVATFEPIKTIIYSQVKFHTGETSSWAISQIKAYTDNKSSMEDGYSKLSWVISTCDNFSEDAYEHAQENKVQLINGTQLSTMLLEAGLVNLDKAI